jgi:DNA mismatch repair protein MutS
MKHNNSCKNTENNSELKRGEIVSKTESIYDEYFRLTKIYISQYGLNTILLMQVGKFFEMYGSMKSINGEIQGSCIKEICEICDLKMSNPGIGTSEYNTIKIMAGFQICYLEKYLQIITDEGYTVVVYVEEKGSNTNTKNKKMNRILYNIYSAGTYIPIEDTSESKLTNNIACIWFEIYTPLRKANPININRYSQMITIGASSTNIYSGKANIFEYETEYYKNPTTFDELERFICMHNPSEVIIISDFSDEELTNIIQYTNIKTNMIHILKKSSNNEKVNNCMKQTYIQFILSKYYGEECIQCCKEFDMYPIATQSFCYLLDFVNTHCPDLVKNINMPQFNNASDRLILANHTLKQLNIIDDLSIDSKKCGKLSSVYSFLNRCCTSMGKRLFQSILLSPVFDEEWLQREYQMIEYMLMPKNNSSIANFRKILNNIKDMEKMSRQLIMKKLYPNSMYHMYESIKYINKINMCLYESPEIVDYLVSSELSKECNKCDYINAISNEIIGFIDNYLKIESCQGETSFEKYSSIIIKEGVSIELDSLVNKYNTQLQFIEDCKTIFNSMMRTIEKSQDVDFIKKHETEKGGISLQMTNKRGQILKMAISQKENIHIKSGNLDYYIPKQEIKVVSLTSSTSEISFPKLDQAVKDVLQLKIEMNEKMNVEYLLFLERINAIYGERLMSLIRYICKLDVLLCKAYISKEYNYCKPIIDNNANKSYVDVKQLRHALIEHIQHNELYVANDICIGKEDSCGILLYGTNAVGKTSIIRALGISIIMAQAGLFVPAKSFIYKPYTAIYSRILGNDNLFKGLSTFAVEMSELRVILNNSDQNSLILGDELCSGTESESALSIFVAGLMELNKRNSTFIFATHFHEITSYDEIKELNGLRLMHLSVYYCKEKDCLVYDRKLKEGSGTRMYGLEVCKSLYLPQDFLDKAYELRTKYHPEVKGELSYKSSSYNSKKIRGLCEICKMELSEEVHHLQEQKNADAMGYIGHIHKNHVANLLNVCSKCHDNIHSKSNSEIKDKNTQDQSLKPKKIIKRKTTKGIILVDGNAENNV